MDGWMRYLKDIQNNRIITAGIIVKMEGNVRKQATTNNWVVDEHEIEKVRKTSYHIICSICMEKTCSIVVSVFIPNSSLYLAANQID